jgi:hypothetical protein
MKDRANAALGNLQRKAYAMSLLRSRIESRINFVLSSGGKPEGVQELTRLLELVRNGELILKEMSDKVESARFLEEFVQIINGAAESVNEIKDDVEELVPMAEAALSEMHGAISHVSKVMIHEAQDEIGPILVQASADASALPDLVKQELQPDDKPSESTPAKPKLSQEQEALEEIAI